MPNGHTGGFEIDTAELKRLITGTPQEDVAASLFTGPSPVASVTATELGRLLEQRQQDRVYIEQHDYTHYIVHLSDDPVTWIMVRPESVLRPSLLARHTQWVAVQQMLAVKTPSVPSQPDGLDDTARRARLAIAVLAAAVFVLLGWLLFWLVVFGQHLPAR